MKHVVYGIPSCKTVKKARKWLDERGVECSFVDLRENPPARAQVARWVKAFGATSMRNTSGGAYRALPAEKKEWSEAAWMEAFSKDPMLLKRPVLEIHGEPAEVGFHVPGWAARF